MNLSPEAQSALDRGEFLCRVFGYEACLKLGWTAASASIFLSGQCPVHVVHLDFESKQYYVDEDYSCVPHPSNPNRDFTAKKIIRELQDSNGIADDEMRASFDACMDVIAGGKKRP